MDDQRLGWSVRSLRHARGWRQVDLARRAGVSASTIRLVEHGGADRLTIGRVRQIAAPLGLLLRWDAGPAPDLARLRDADHAAIADLVAERLSRHAWVVRPEFSFNHYGERGRIDILAFHPRARVVLVLEIKTVVADLQELLGTLDAKRRVAGRVAPDLGWRPRATVPGLIVAESTTARRRIGGHAALFARFNVRGWQATAWLADPATIPDGLLMFEKLPNRNHGDRRRAGRQRVRLPGRSVSTNPQLRRSGHAGNHA